MAKAAKKAAAKADEPPVTPADKPAVAEEKLGPHDTAGEKLAVGDKVTINATVHGVDDHSVDQNSVVTVQVKMDGDEDKFFDIALPAGCFTKHSTKK